MSWSVRPAGAADVAQLLAVRTSVKENLIDQAELAARGIDQHSLIDMLANTHHGWCVDVDGELAGFTMAEREQARIFALFVRPSCEGLGVGSALLAAAVTWMQGLGHRRAILSTDPGTRAYDFYTRQGWTHTRMTADGEAQFELYLQVEDSRFGDKDSGTET